MVDFRTFNQVFFLKCRVSDRQILIHNRNFWLKMFINLNSLHGLYPQLNSILHSYQKNVSLKWTIFPCELRVKTSTSFEQANCPVAILRLYFYNLRLCVKICNFGISRQLETTPIIFINLTPKVPFNRQFQANSLVCTGSALIFNGLNNLSLRREVE